MIKREMNAKLSEIRDNLNFSRNLNGDEIFLHPVYEQIQQPFRNLWDTHIEWYGENKINGKITINGQDKILFFALERDRFIVFMTNNRNVIGGYSWGRILPEGPIIIDEMSHDNVQRNAFYGFVYDTILTGQPWIVDRVLN